MKKNDVLLSHPDLSYEVDRGRFKSPPSFYDGKRDIPGTKKALRVLSHSRINGSNRWRCVLHLLSAN